MEGDAMKKQLVLAALLIALVGAAAVTVVCPPSFMQQKLHH